MSRKSVYSSQESLDIIATSHDQNRLDCDSAQPDINVLLLGQTGIGKTTFINAFANHLIYDSLGQALEGELFSVTSATFFIQDIPNRNLRKIDFGVTDSNEQFSEKGYSVTQGCQSYVFAIGTRKLRLIDAPGIGDTRGPIQDMDNFEHTLDYISQYQYLNGICILLKPNEERLNILFSYCLKELLTHLHRSAVGNIMFVFTYSQSTDYKPGATNNILQNLLNEISSKTGTTIPFSDDNTFFLDNEGFRFLAASKKGMKFPRGQLDRHAKSWKKSSQGYAQLFSSISRRFPHELQETVSINAAQQHIRKLTRPLAEVARLIAENIKLIEQSKGQGRKRIEQRSGRLVKFKHPRTVCTNEKCTRVIMNDGQLRVDYFQHCHTECYLRKVDEEVIRHPKLRRCQAMDRNSGICKACDCAFEKHMHIRYEYEAFTTYVDVGDSTEELCTVPNSEKSWQKNRIRTSSIKNRVTQLKHEEDFMIETYARFSAFLDNNSIAPYNDAFIEYLDHFIQEEKIKQNYEQNNGTLLTDLTNLSVQYKREKERYRGCKPKRAMEGRTMHSTPSETDATPELISELIEKLFALPINGKFIHEQVKHLKSTRTHNVRLLEKTVALLTSGHSASLVMRALETAFSEEIVYF